MNKTTIGILGAGRSGKAAAQLAECLDIDAKIMSDDDTPVSSHNFDNCQLIVVSPGIPPISPIYREAVASGREIISELEFAARHFAGKYLAITGTNGKTTTTELTVHLLQALKISAIAAGNIGHPFSAVCADVINGRLPVDTIPVIEVSSFQLERTSVFAPLAALILNIAEDHLDRYPGGMSEYSATKEKIFKKVLPENQIYGITYKAEQASSKFKIEDDFIKFNNLDIVSFDKLKLKGIHNQENVLGALELISRLQSLTESDIAMLKNALKTYNPGKHRIEKVMESNGISYIDDSKGTNPAAVIAALQSIPGTNKNIRLILGGLDKGMDFAPLKDYSARIKKIYILGECREKLYKTLHDVLDCEKFIDFDKCVLAACHEALEGDTVLLSPGCASWDMFKNYKERGNRFRKLVTNNY
jgi:UDP-N-acetylmuramoylalanine--D-glutamate ligase